MRRETRVIARSALLTSSLLFLAPAIADADETAPVEVTTNLTLVTAPQDGATAFTAAATESVLGNLRQHLNAGAPNNSLTVEVGAGKRLTIEKLRGGRRTLTTPTTLTKTGAGTLRILDAAPYGGTLKLMGGTLDLSARPVPTLADLPANPFLHVDATKLAELTTVESGGKTFVTYWKNEGSGTVGEESVDGLRPWAYDAHPTYFRPWLLKDALGPGRHTVDFGTWNPSKPYNATAAEEAGETWPVECGMMTFAKSSSENVTTLPKNFRTVIALVGAQRGGGLVVGAAYVANANRMPFDRGVNWEGARNWTFDICGDYEKDSVTYPASVWQDGRRMATGGSFETPAYHVIAMKQEPGDFSFRYIGGREHVSYSGPIGGGCILGEVFIYDRDLTETEIRDVQAYLMDKWFGETAGGYVKAGGFASLQDVQIAAASAISIPAGQTNRIDTLTLDAPLTVTGGGTLEIFDLTFNGELIYEDSSEVRYVDRPDAGDVLCAVPPGVSFRLDACATNAITTAWSTTTGATTQENGTNLVSRVASVGSRGLAMEGGQPRFALDYFNGKPVLDMFPRERYLYLYPMDSVRGVFMVQKGSGGSPNAKAADQPLYDGGFLIGSSSYTDFGAGNKNAAIYDYFRDANLLTASGPNGNRRFFGNNGNDVLNAAGGTLYVNGVSCSKNEVFPDGTFQLVEIYGNVPTHVSAIKMGMDRTSYGGGYVGELAIYERALTDREKVQMRNYLMKKWFDTPDEDLTPLPAKPASKAGLIAPTVMTLKGNTVEVGSTTISNLTFRGYGKIVKSGADTVIQSTDLNSFTGTVEVTEGTLTVNGYRTSRAGALKSTDLLAHFTVEEGVVTVSGLGSKVTEWTNTVTTGTYAGMFAKTIVDSATTKLKYDREIDANYVDMPSYGMWWHDTAGNLVKMSGIRAVVWAVGTQDGGGLFLGGGGSGGYGWHRGDQSGGTPGYSTEDSIIHASSSQPGVRQTSNVWRLNDAAIDARYSYPSGGWDALSLSIPSDTYDVTAEGFALESRSGGIRQGHQRLMEVAIYGAPLSTEEQLDAEAYMMNKWHLHNTVGPATNDVDLVLAAGTALETGGNDQYFRSVAGAGATVTRGGLTTQKLVYDFASAATTLAVNGSFTFAPGFTVELKNAPGAFEPVTLATATTLAGLDNYAAKCVTGGNGAVLVYRWDGANSRYLLIVRQEGIVAAETDLTIANDNDLVRTLSGTGAVTKTGAGELTLKGLADYAGTLHVTEGAVTVVGTPAAAAPALPLDGRLAHFDANVGLELVYTSTGLQVSKWNSQVGDFYAQGLDASYFPLRVDELNYKPVVQLNHYMRFYDSANTNVYLSGIKTVLWVIGSQEGGGFILGGGRGMDGERDGYAWHRGGSGYGDDVTNPILCQSAILPVFQGQWWTNSVAIANILTTPFSGSYDQISYRTATDDVWASASAFASDTRGSDRRDGYQRLGEVVIYDRRLSDAELAAAQAYLDLKWGLNGTVSPGDSDAAVVVDAGATLDMGGTNHVVRSVCGAGTVTGDLQAKELKYDFAHPQVLTVGGTFAFGAGFAVATAGTPSGDKPVKILSASNFANRANFSRTAVTGPAAEKYRLTLRADGLYLRPVSGVVLLVR